MYKSLAAGFGWIALGCIVAGLVHVRSDVVVERYALGEATRHLAKIERDSQVLRERWARATDPVRLEARVRAELGMHVAKVEQILK